MMMFGELGDFADQYHVVAFVHLGVALADEMRGGAFDNRAAFEIVFPVAMREAVGWGCCVFAGDVHLRFGEHAD